MPACVSCVAERLRARALLGPDAQEEHLDLLVERRRVGEDAAVGGLRIEAAAAAAAAAEAADVGELVEVRQGGRERLHAAHREPGHRPVLAARRHAVRRLDHRDEVGEHHLGERPRCPAGAAPRRRGRRRRAAACGRRGGRLRAAGGGSWHRLRERATGAVEGRALARLHGIQVVHHDDHRPGLLLGDQVVHDHVDVALDVPALLVLSPAVHQVEHGVLRLGVGLVVRAACRRRPGATAPVTVEKYQRWLTWPCGTFLSV